MSKTKVEKTHSLYSPSSADRWTNCPASINFCKDLPALPNSKYSDEGTEAHDVLETLIKNRLQGARGKHLDKLTAFLKTQHPEEMVEHALDAFDYIVNELWGARAGVELVAEEEVDISHFTRHGEKGTLDAAIIEEFGELIIVDYKYGAGLMVEAEENRQLLCYALAAAKKYDYNFHTVRIVVIQPRAGDDEGNTEREWKISIEALLKWEKFFKKAYLETTKKNAKFAYGDWCRWCRGAAICKEVSTKAIEQAQIDFSDETGLEAVPEPTTLPVKQLKIYLDAADRLETWISGVRSMAYTALERGHKIEGHKLVHKEARRKWNDAEKIQREAKKKWGPRVLAPEKLLSPAQLEKDLGKDFDKAMVKKWVQERVSAVSSGLTLVTEDDTREAFDPLKGFDDLPKQKGKRKK